MTVSGMVYRDEHMVIWRHVATVEITGWNTVLAFCKMPLFCWAEQEVLRGNASQK